MYRTIKVCFLLLFLYSKSLCAQHSSLEWIGEQDISTHNVSPYTSEPKVVISRDGKHAIAIYLWVGGEVKSISGVLSGDRFIWGPVYVIGGWSSNSTIFPPEVEISDDGSMATAVWSSSNAIWSASATINGNIADWSNKTIVRAEQIGYSDSKVKLGLSTDGTKATAVWKNNPRLYSASAVITGNNASWSQPVEFAIAAPTTSITGDFDFALSSNGEVGLALWEFDYRKPYSQSNMTYIQSSLLNVTGNIDRWSESVNISSSSTMDANSLNIDMSDDGIRATALWYWDWLGTAGLSNPENGLLQSASATIDDQGTNWGAISNIATSPYPNIPGPSLAMTSDGMNAIVTWYENFDQSINASTSLISGNGAIWGNKVILSQGIGDYRNHIPLVRISRDGSVGMILTWENGKLGGKTARISENQSTWGEFGLIPLVKHTFEGVPVDDIYRYRQYFDLSPDAKYAVAVYEQAHFDTSIYCQPHCDSWENFSVATGKILLDENLTASVLGNGLITSIPSGINCGSDCTENYSSGTNVTLTATPTTGWQFSGWSGACSGTGSCNVIMDSNKSITATFNQIQTTNYTLNAAVSGSGTVYSNPAGINCGSDCFESYTAGSNVTLTANPSSGWQFSGWSGACSGTGTCNVNMNGNKSVTAIFTQVQTASYTLNATISGSGAVYSNPAGINCGSDCTENYSSGTNVTLTATPTTGWQFSGWSGACSGTGACNVLMNSNKSVIASFSQNQQTINSISYSFSISGFVEGGSTSINFNPGGTDCGYGCISYYSGTTVTLTANSSGYNFDNWSGDCWGANPCVLYIDANKSVTANYSVPPNRTLTVTKSGLGAIISNPQGIDCGQSCSYAFLNNSTVSLIAVPGKGYTFVGWDGACSGRGSCSVYMGSNQSVSARFVNTYTLIQPALQLLLE